MWFVNVCIRVCTCKSHNWVHGNMSSSHRGLTVENRKIVCGQEGKIRAQKVLK